MTNGITVGDYVTLLHGHIVCKVIDLEDHPKHYADVHIVFSADEEVCHEKRRVDELTKLDPDKIDAPIKQALDSFPSLISQDEDFKEDFPGQNREAHIQRAVQRAVTVADAIIIDASDGSLIETDYLTFRVAEAFLSKLGNRVVQRFQGKLMGIKVQD